MFFLKYEDPGVSEWTSIRVELSSGNSSQNAENPGPRNVLECLDLFRILSANSSQNAKQIKQKNVSECLDPRDKPRHSETFFGVFLAIFAYLLKKRDEKTVVNPRHSETFRGPGF